MIYSLKLSSSIPTKHAKNQSFDVAWWKRSYGYIETDLILQHYQQLWFHLKSDMVLCFPSASSSWSQVDQREEVSLHVFSLPLHTWHKYCKVNKKASLPPFTLSCKCLWSVGFRFMIFSFLGSETHQKRKLRGTVPISMEFLQTGNTTIDTKSSDVLLKNTFVNHLFSY